MGSLEGKVVLVTGAAKRIGRGIALRLAQEGARVAIHYGNSEAEALATAEECAKLSGHLVPTFSANLESVEEIEGLFAEVEQHCGRIDGLVNNAARFTLIDPLKITEADWDFIHSVNLKGTFFCCQQAAKRMLGQGGGRIVNITSQGALKAWPEHAHYCAAKAGLAHMTRALAMAWAPQIAVNAVAPGVIPFGDDVERNERIPRMIARTPAKRAGTADDVADAVLFFLTATGFITGQQIAVDGGLSLR